MRIFVTGATGFIGSAIVPELIKAGHQVIGLARSEANAKSLAAAGAQVHRGSLEDPESLRSGAAASDGVIHAAFIHDFSNYAASAEADRRAIETMGKALAGSERLLLVTGGTLLVAAQGRPATEKDPVPTESMRKSEAAAAAASSQGGRVSAVRLPPTVHGDGDHGFVPMIINIAREKKVSAYVGDGSNRWPAVHRLDAATLYRLAMEKGTAGMNYHCVADQGVPTREIAEVIGRRLSVPVVSKSGEEAKNHFGWMTYFFSIDNPTSSQFTQEHLGWKPNHAALIPDLDRPAYFQG